MASTSFEFPPFPDQDTVNALKAKHPRVRKLIAEHDGGEIVIIARPPTRPEWKRLMNTQVDERADEIETLVRSVTLWPDATVMKAALDEYPGIAQTFYNDISEMAGVETQVRSEKL